MQKSSQEPALPWWKTLPELPGEIAMPAAAPIQSPTPAPARASAPGAPPAPAGTPGASLTTPTQLSWADQNKFDTLKGMLGTVLLLGGAGVGARSLYEVFAGPKLPLAKERRRMLGKQAELQTTQTVPRGFQQLLSALPHTGMTNAWDTIPLAVTLPLSAAAAAGGWSGAGAVIDRLRKRQLSQETERAKEDYARLFSDYYRSALQRTSPTLQKVAEVVHAASDATMEKQAAGLHRTLLGVYLASVLGAGLIGHNQAYSSVMKQRQQGLEQAQRARRQQQRDRRDPLPLDFLEGPSLEV